MKKNNNVQELRLAFYRIFKNKDPFNGMFNAHISQKILLCPTDGYYLDKKQFNALIKAVKQIEEDFFYLSEVEGECFLEHPKAQGNYEFNHWELSNKTLYHDYKKNPLVLENAIYSPKGTWGILISHEDHAVLGGSEEFVKLFKQSYPEWKQNIEYFIKMWEYNKEHYKSDITWVASFLDYINQT